MINRLALVMTAALACSSSASNSQSNDTAAKPHDHRKHSHDHKDHFDHRFDNAEKWAKQFDDPKRDEWQKPARVVELLEIKEGMTVADIGAGTGYFLPWFSKAVGASGVVLGLDIEQDMVDYMSERAERQQLSNVSAKLVAKDDPGLGQTAVDRVVIVNTWHHIGGRVEYGKKLAKALKPGGTVAIVDFTMDAPRGPPKKHRLAESEVVTELEAAGFQAKILEEDLPIQYIVIGFFK